LNEFELLGLIKNGTTSIHGAQAEGCAPVADAFETGKETIQPVANPNTIAKSIAIGDPGDGTYAIQVANTTGGTIGKVSDAEIREAIRLLASKEGIFTEPAGAVTIALLKKLVDGGQIRPDESVVCFINGNGLKSVEAVQSDRTRWYSLDPTLRALKTANVDA
jgi:threonine synthase